ncbi:hypothetical protein L2E82_49236 [Cichorium intybus]|uniref:Uncharacterized protein n=1 Tax=Cichorium intybus TaxID=13427 RepID=A0ACB8YZQ9_CICIN|nr:hypothetical protein L2E82_49236 [Cichorium intybus]
MKKQDTSPCAYGEIETSTFGLDLKGEFDVVGIGESQCIILIEILKATSQFGNYSLTSITVAFANEAVDLMKLLIQKSEYQLKSLFNLLADIEVAIDILNCLAI